MLTDTAAQTSPSLSPQKVLLKRKLKSVSTSLQRIRRRKFIVPVTHQSCSPRNLMSVLKNYMSEPCFELFSCQIQLNKTKSHGRRYSDYMKMLALALYHYSARGYSLLSKFMIMPSKSSLCMWVQGVCIHPGLSNHMCSILRCRFSSLSNLHKLAVLCIDEMSIKRNLFYCTSTDDIKGFEQYGPNTKQNIPATSVLVFFLRGLTSNWKQPLSYYFVSGSCKADIVKKLVFEVLNKVSEIGVQIVAVVTDQGSNFVKLHSLLGVMNDKPFIFHNDCKIFLLYDPPHLLKSIRNNFFKYSIIWENKQTSWKDIESFYNIDSQQQFRLARKLSPMHIHPQKLSRMKVKFAAQIFSASVAAGIAVHCQHKSLPPEAMATAELCSRLNNLFDAVNSSHIKSPNKLQRAISEGSGHIEFLQSNIEWLKSVKIFDTVNSKFVTNNVKCVQGWIKTINSVTQLFLYLREKYDLKFLLTRRLNQDCLENFFGVIRTKGGCCDNPTAVQFVNHFKRVCCTSLLLQVTTGNTAADDDQMLINLKSCLSLKNVTKHSSVKHNVSNLNKVSVSDFTIRSMPEQNAFVYVCGYLLKKMLAVHNCEICALLKQNASDLGSGSYICMKNYHDCALFVPSINFTMYISRCENLFAAYFKDNRHLPGIGDQILEILQEVDKPVHCQQFPQMYLLKLFIRVRIHYVLRFENRSNCQRKSFQKKLAKLQSK